MFSKLFLFTCLLGLSQCTIDNELIQELEANGSADVLVDFEGNNGRAISRIAQRSFRSRISRVKALNIELRSQADDDQGPVQRYLEENGIEYHSFWSSNQMIIEGANLSTVEGVDGFDQVAGVRMVPAMPWDPFLPGVNTTSNSSLEWGLDYIGAGRVWEEFNVTGEGVVVANIDTGVRVSHEALNDTWREAKGWFDPYTFTKTPDDAVGHGTHVMGTTAGRLGVGVAPNARWIACRGCNDQGCDLLQLLACGQFMLAPTNPDGTEADESMMPDVICNSWGSSRGGIPWYAPTLCAWKTAGIMHAFAFGNSGPMCGSGGSPGDLPNSFAVASIDAASQLSLFSSKGPSFFLPFGALVKPQISAPGSDIRSAWHDGDTSYNIISGTSMAAPHVTGVMALMLSAKRAQQKDPLLKLDFDKVTDTIQETAVTDELGLGLFNFACDAPPEPLMKMRFPNTQFGYGRIDAVGAVRAILGSTDSSESEGEGEGEGEGGTGGGGGAGGLDPSQLFP